MKFSVELNCAPRQNTRFSSSLQTYLKEDSKWAWTTEFQEAFEKNIGIQELNFFFDTLPSKKEIIVASDASSYGIGACIMYKLKDVSIKLIAHVSRTLLAAGNNYSVIEKESLGIVFALKKFYRFIHRRRFTLQRDLRPLLAIFGSKKGLPTPTVLWEPYSSHHNRLFSPLLILRDFAARGAYQYRCYPNSTRLLTFSM